MSAAVNVSIGLNYVEKIDVTPHVCDGKTFAFLDIDGISILGTNPEMFRRLASRCSEAAAILEAANVPAPVEPVVYAVGCSVTCDNPDCSICYPKSNATESGVA